MKKLKIGSKMNLVFAAVMFITLAIFFPIVMMAFRFGYEQQHKVYLDEYHQNIVEQVRNQGVNIPNTSIGMPGHLIVVDNKIINENELIEYEQFGVSKEIAKRIASNVLTQNETIVLYSKYSKNLFYQATLENNIWVISVSNQTIFISTLSNDVPFFVFFIFINVFALGTIVIWLFSRSIVLKLQQLTKDVENMAQTNYNKPILIEGADEISELAHSIDRMRSEISINEFTKQEMIQNIGHDLKTPIAVIKSYSEAIIDGVSEPKDAEIIIKQADNLYKRVQQLLEYNQALYLSVNEEVKEIALQTVIMQAVEHFKYLAQVDIITDLDDSTYPITANHLYIVLTNILDNALRYAKTQIVICLIDKKITIFNDGEHIDEKIKDKIFRPYEKGSKGQFGLGMGIVKQTLNRYDLNVSVLNVKNGVEFTIEPI